MDDKKNSQPECVCGQPSLAGVVHRSDGPCYIKPPIHNGKYLTGYKAQPEPPCKTGSQCVGGKCERCAEPEPVAWNALANHYCYLLDNLGDLPIPNFEKWANEQWKKGSALLDANDYFRAAPSRKEWQGLTDEEMLQVCWQAGFDIHEDYDNEDDDESLHWWTEDGEQCDDTLFKLRDLIEAKLREKNES